MRTFEAYLIYLAMYVTLHEILPLTWYATISLAVVTVAHLILERPRWQLAIAYGQVAYLLYAILISTSASWPAGYVFIALFEVGLLVSSALACLFPIAKFPELTGRYQTVGIDERFMLTKTSGPAGSTRPRSPSVDLTVYPELGMSVYYPSSLARPTKEGAQFLTSASISSLSSFLGLPNFLFQPLTLGRIRAVNNAPMARGSDLGLESRFPVILYSHGLGGHGHMYSIQCCELASQGYVVFAPTHNDGSSCVAELRSQIVPYKRLPGVPVHGDEEVAMRASQLRMRAREMEYLLDLITEGEADNGSGWSHISVSQKSPSSSSPPPYAGRLDLSRVGLIGHSFGAGTVTHVAAALASRVKCLIAHDVWLHPLRSQEPPTHTIPLQVPSLFTACDFWVNWPDQWEQIKYLLSQSHDSTLLHMNELQHSNFSDVPLFSQLVARKMKQIGPNNFRECAARVNAIQVAFLAQHILGQDGAFELALKKNPQAIVIQRNP